MDALMVVLGALAGAVAGALTGMLVARRDRARRQATERELAGTRRELQAARAARDAFYDTTTHELRAPLAAILGYQELLEDGAFGELGDEGQDAVHRIGRSARHLLHLVEGVVELSKLRTGHVRPDVSDVDLGGLLSSAADAFRTQASDRGITPHIEMPDELPTIRSDSHRLARALDLIITSAVRHPEGDTMEFRVSRLGDEVALTIGPLGLTLAPDPDDSGDLGIRLAVATRIATLLDGRLELPTEGKRVHALVLHLRPVQSPQRL